MMTVRWWQPARADLGLVAAYWLVVVPILLLQYWADTGWPLGRILVLAGVTVALDTLTVALLVGGLLTLLLSRHYWRGLALLPGFLLASGCAYLSLYSHLRGHAATWSLPTVGLAIVAHAKSYGLLAVLLTGRRYFAAQQRVLQLQKTQAEAELRVLQAQLDPHFLFNNLHVLHVLIGQDAQMAEEFLHRFAGLYRYLLRHRAADFVSLAEELAFFDEYVFLLRHRFGTAYHFELTLAPGLDPVGLQVVPGTVQLLLENAIKHNVGDEDDPLPIQVAADGAELRVSNLRRPKRTAAGDSTGIGLPNLRQRYQLLTGATVQVETDAQTFRVRVPLLHQRPAPEQAAATPFPPTLLTHAPAHSGR
jgi:two-component system LytT family sensor kinase